MAEAILVELLLPNQLPQGDYRPLCNRQTAPQSPFGKSSSAWFRDERCVWWLVDM